MRGHFRGMSQSRSTSPAPSYVLSPYTSVVNWGDSKNSIHSASSSVIDFSRSMEGSIVSLPKAPQAAKKIPSPLRLNPSAVPGNSRVSTNSSFGGSYMPPLPSPRSVRSFANPQAHSSWVSPLDVHFSRPTTPQGSATKQDSYLPHLQFPEPAGKNGLLVPTPAGSVAGAVNSEVASIVSSNAAAAQEPAPQAPPQKSSTSNFNFFDSEVPTRPSRQSTRSIFPATSDDDRPISRRTNKSFDENFGPIPNIPQNIFGPKSPGLDLSQYGQGAIIRDSIVSKRSVSIYQPQTPHTPTEPTTSHLQAHSRVASSIYSISASERPSERDRESIIDITPDSRSRPMSTSQPNAKSRSRSRSTSSKRPASSHTLSRTQDSIRRHSRKMSVIEKRRSRERDQLHYDPTSQNRNRSGSVQGRSVDFDRPRESPFSNASAISHSANSSISTASSTSLPWQKAADSPESQEPEPPLPKPQALLSAVVDANRLSVATAASRRGRSASEASQLSMGFGDFYDAYYRQSGLARASQLTANSSIFNSGLQTGGARGSGSSIAMDLHVAGVGMALTSGLGNGGAGNGGMRTVARPPPLKWAGSGLGVEETIVEVATPVSSPLVGGGVERFPNRF